MQLQILSKLFFQTTISQCLGQAELPPKWLDIRGNHDTYQVVNEESQVGIFFCILGCRKDYVDYFTIYFEI